MSEVISEGAIVVFLMLLVYMGLGNIIESQHCVFGHEASFTILVGKFKTHDSLFTHFFRDGHIVWLVLQRTRGFDSNDEI